LVAEKEVAIEPNLELLLDFLFATDLEEEEEEDALPLAVCFRFKPSTFDFGLPPNLSTNHFGAVSLFLPPRPGQMEVKKKYV